MESKKKPRFEGTRSQVIDYLEAQQRKEKKKVRDNLICLLIGVASLPLMWYAWLWVLAYMIKHNPFLP